MAITLRRDFSEGYLDFQTIWGRIQSLIDDDDSDTLTVIKEVVPMVYHDILSRYRGKSKLPRWMVDYDDTLTTTASTRTTTLNTSGKEVERIIKISVQSGTSWYRCDPISLEELENHPNWWVTTNTQRPTRFFHSKNYSSSGGETNILTWFYLPDAAYTFRYWFEKRFSPLANAEDVPQLPPFSHEALIYGSLIHLAMFDIKVKVGPWAEFYTKRLRELDAFSNNFVLNPAEARGFGEDM